MTRVFTAIGYAAYVVPAVVPLRCLLVSRARRKRRRERFKALRERVWGLIDRSIMLEAENALLKAESTRMRKTLAELRDVAAEAVAHVAALEVAMERKQGRRVAVGAEAAWAEFN